MRGVEQIPWLYDAFMDLVERFGLGRWRARLIQEVGLAVNSGGRTLELGCGTGRNLPLYPPELPVVATDPDLRLLLAARRRSPGTTLVVADAQHLPFADDSFETVVSCLVFCSVPQPRLGLSESARALRREGALWMLEHVRHPGLRGRLQDFIQPIWTRVSGGCHPNRDTESELRRAGFRVDSRKRRARRNLRLLRALPPD